MLTMPSSQFRRKFARWADDNAAALKEAKPAVPSGLNNRAAMNWTLLLAIAEAAGGEWPERAREAAKQLTRKGRLPSDGIKLLDAIRTMFAKTGKTEITSEALVAELRKDPTAIWADYNHGGPITQRQIAFLLSAYENPNAHENIHPLPLHPTKSKDFAVKATSSRSSPMHSRDICPAIQSSDHQRRSR
jgi:hypothetical protein